MTKTTCPTYCRNPKRAILKIASLAALLLLFVGLLSLTIDHDAISRMKFDLSLWTVIALVLIINLLSAACFIVMYAAYLWIRRDLKPPRSEDMPDQDPNAA